MSIFVTLLAFDNTAIVDSAKLAIIITSVLSGVVGYEIIRLAKN